MSADFILNVLIVDDHKLFRMGMDMFVKSFSEVRSVYQASNGKEALEVLMSSKIDVVLLDLEMPVMDGWEASKEIIAEYPTIKIIVISMHDSLQTVSDLIECGVHSYLLKDATPEDVHKAIISVVNNDFYYNNLVSRALHKRIKSRKSVVEDLANITPRETEILSLICQELTMKEIGELLFLSEQTVQNHRKNLMKKTKAKNTVGLVKFAFQKGIASF